MYCKNCLYYRDIVSIERAMCEKTGKAVESIDRPCDYFILRGHMTDEWGECQGGRGCS